MTTAWRPPTRPSAESSFHVELEQPSLLAKVQAALVMPRTVYVSAERVYSHYIDRTVIWVKARWVAFATALLFYMLRVLIIDGFFIVTYALGIYLLNLLIGFLSPSVDPEDEHGDGLGDISLPSSETDEFRPFTRKLAEFQFWFWGMRSVLLSIVATFFRFFDLPVFWPILLFYFVFLFFITMKQQIMHMIKHKYVPWSTGQKGHK